MFLNHGLSANVVPSGSHICRVNLNRLFTVFMERFAEHYKVDPAKLKESHASTIDYVISATAG